MSFDELLQIVGGAAGVAGLAAALAAFFIWLLKQSILKRLDVTLEEIGSKLRRMERLEADLFQLRAGGYGEIWKLTGALNLFGTENPVDAADLSDRFRDWYFEHGQVLQDDAKKRYFLVQEVLGFARVHSLSFQRPDDEELYSGTTRTIDVIKEMREKGLKIKPPPKEKDHALDDLERCVSEWKSAVDRPSEVAKTDNWLLLQFLLSKLRTRLIIELGVQRS